MHRYGTIKSLSFSYLISGSQLGVSSSSLATMPTRENKLLSSFLILCLLLQVFVEAASDNIEGVTLDKPSHLPKINCPYACARRCREASRKKVCKRACGTCCLKCQCVPPGTYGNRSACPCYASLKTHGKKPKCP